MSARSGLIRACAPRHSAWVGYRRAARAGKRCSASSTMRRTSRGGLSGGAGAGCLLPRRAGAMAAEWPLPSADPLLGCGAAPDPVRFAGPHREVQALLPHPAAGADPPRLGDLPTDDHTCRDREEQVRVGGQARACRPYWRLITRVAPGFPGCPAVARCSAPRHRRFIRFPAGTSVFAARGTNLLAFASVTTGSGGGRHVPPRYCGHRSRPHSAPREAPAGRLFAVRTGG
jgi:hypothetical protein